MAKCHRLKQEVTLQEMRLMTALLPCAVNAFVIDELIDWQPASSDPNFQLTFPQRDTLSLTHEEKTAAAFQSDDKLRARTAGMRKGDAL